MLQLAPAAFQNAQVAAILEIGDIHVADLDFDEVEQHVDRHARQRRGAALGTCRRRPDRAELDRRRSCDLVGLRVPLETLGQILEKGRDRLVFGELRELTRIGRAAPMILGNLIRASPIGAFYFRLCYYN
jgi:hypothetical protein